jgi:hypothetical protein
MNCNKVNLPVYNQAILTSNIFTVTSEDISISNKTYYVKQFIHFTDYGCFNPLQVKSYSSVT